MAKSLETILVNFSAAKIRREVIDGRSYLIAPASLIPADGVLEGSKGPLFYPTSETKKAVPAWNGMPITKYHPMDSMGNPLSARDRGVLDRQGMGYTRNAEMNGKLRLEMCFDENRTQALDPVTYGRLIRNQPVELSTGLFTYNEPSRGVAPNGRYYDAIARNHQPDHVAILPDQIGACSNRDGCGVLVNQQKAATMNRQTDSRTRLERFVNWITNATQLKHQETGQFLPKSGASQKQTHADAVRGYENTDATKGRDVPEETVDLEDDSEDGRGKTTTRREPGLETRVTPDKGGLPNEMQSNFGKSGPVVVGGSDGIDDAEDKKPTDNDDVHPVKMTPASGAGTVEGLNKVQQFKDAPSRVTNDYLPQQVDSNMEPQDPHDVTKQAAAASMEHPPAREHAMGAVDASGDGNHGKASKLHGKAATEHESAATDSRKDDDEDGAMDHDQAAALHRKAASMHTATMNEQRRRAIMNLTREQKIATLTANCKCDKERGAFALLNNATLDVLLNAKAEGSNADVATGGPGGKSVQAGGEEEDRADRTADKDNYRSEDEFTGKVARVGDADTKGKKMASAITNMSREDREALDYGKQAMLRDKRALVGKLVANVSDKDRRVKLGNKYMQRSIPELRELISLMPPVQNQFQGYEEGPTLTDLPNYLGAAAPVGNADYGFTSNSQADGGSAEDEGTILRLESRQWDYAAIANENRQQNGQRQAN